MIKAKKKHHYVPRFYLKHFESTDGKLAVFRKSTGKIFGGNINDFGHENRFYEIPDPEGDLSQDQRQAVEDLFAAIESDFAGVVNRLVQKLSSPSFIHKSGSPNYFLSTSEKLALSAHFVTQSFRTPEVREGIRQHSYLMTLATSKMMAAMDPRLKGVERRLIDSLDVELSEEYITLSHLKVLLDQKMLTGLINICMSKIWLLGINRTELPLYTSDHPVNQIFHKESHPFRGQGWVSGGMELALPLSPKLILILLPRDLFSISLEELTSIGMVPNEVFELSRENIEFYNSHQFFKSYDFLFSVSTEFSQAKSMSQEQPEHTNPYRQRLSVHGGLGTEHLPRDWPRRRKKSSSEKGSGS